MQSPYSDIPGFLFHLLYWNFAMSMNREENKKRITISVDNTVNDLHHEIKFENCVKNKNIYFLFLEEYFIRFLRIQLLQHFFCWDRYQKHRCTSEKASAVNKFWVEFWTLSNIQKRQNLHYWSNLNWSKPNECTPEKFII